MKYKLRSIVLPGLPKVESEKLSDVARSVVDTNGDTISRGPWSYKLRNINEIITAIQNEESLTQLEWVYCLYKKDSWDCEHPELAASTALKIWEIAFKTPELRKQLLWKLLLVHSGTGQLPQSLLKTFRESQLYAEDSLTLKVLRAIDEGESIGTRIAKLSVSAMLMPEELLARAELPTKSHATQLALHEVAKVFTSSIASPSAAQIDWLLACLNSMDSRQLPAQAEVLIPYVSKAGLTKTKLFDWLLERFGPRTPSSKWSELSEAAKAELRKQIGTVTYGEFGKWAQRILDTTLLSPTEFNQLGKRSKFWLNYSDRFERLRILLPRITVSVLGSSISRADYDTLEDDGSSPTEVCIFDLGEIYIVEFFRGPGSETRLFQKDTLPLDIMAEERLSIRKLRALGGERHDHRYLWQWSCEKWLRGRRIYPNSGTTYFHGLARNHGKYCPTRGLPEPERWKQLERKQKLVSWERDIEKLEQKARDWVDKYGG